MDPIAEMRTLTPVKEIVDRLGIIGGDPLTGGPPP